MYLRESIRLRRDYLKVHSSAAESLGDKLSVQFPEYALGYLIYLLAHHNDVEEGVDRVNILMKLSEKYFLLFKLIN